MFKKIIEFLRKIGMLHGGSAKWKGKGTGDYMTADLDKHRKEEHPDQSEHEE